VLLRATVLLGLAFLPGCATIVTTPSQDVAVTTEPAGAACTFHRNGQQVGALTATPGTVRIGKSGRETGVSCTREGYQPAQATLQPSLNPWFIGNILLGGIVGIIVDASTGAVSRYPESVQLAMTPNPAPPPAPPVYMDPTPEPEPVLPRRAGRRQPGA
jgi:hypothetical protein